MTPAVAEAAPRPVPRHFREARALAAAARSIALILHGEGDAAAVVAEAIAADWRIIAGVPAERGICAPAERIALMERIAADYREEARRQRARLSDRAGRYADRYGHDAVRADIADGFRVEPQARAWARAARHAELADTLLWWERDAALGASFMAARAARRLNITETEAA